MHRDRFGRTWRWSLADAGDDAGASSFAAVDVAISLIYFAFDAAGAHDSEAAHALLDVYESIAGHTAARPDDVDFRRALQSTVRRAVETGWLRLERIADPHGRPPDVEEPRTTAPAPLAPAETKGSFSVTVLDEVGDPVDGVDVAFSSGPARHVVPTNGSGEARLDGVDESRMNASLVSVDAARATLKPRWATPRQPKIKTGEAVTVRELVAPIDPVSVEANVPATLVLTPFFQCHEVAGTHFQFGRSFVRSDAFELLARIAEALSADDGRKALILGHTDLAGTDALNKELSERRAHALFALFTHDGNAWETLFSGTDDGPNWKEKWDLEEAQHMLNTLTCGDDKEAPINERGIRDASTKQAIHRFQAGNYQEKPAEQAALANADVLGVDRRRELFLAYAKRVTRRPVDAARFTKVGGSSFMGCGEFNPLSLSARDLESRRANVFVFDPAAEPQSLPCRLRDLGPCNANSGPAPKEAEPEGKPPFRCRVFQNVASKCPCQGGADVSHDLVVRFPFSLDAVDGFRHVLVMESDDGTIIQKKTLKDDARALDPTESEVSFTHLPPAHEYRMRVEGIDQPHEVFAFTPFEKLSGLSRADGVDDAQLEAAALQAEAPPSPPPDAPPAPEDVPF